MTMFRQQESTQTHSEVFGTTAGLVDRMDIPKSTVFRAFREVDKAAKFMQKNEGCTGRIKRYSSHKNDIRVIVHYVGKPKRDRIKLAPKRYLVKDGINVNRQLPMVINFGEV